MTTILWCWRWGNVRLLWDRKNRQRDIIQRQSQIGLVLFMTLALLYIHQPYAQANEVCEAVSLEADVLNTLPETIEEDGVTVIGHLPDRNYVVVVPGRRESLLTEVRRYIPDAFMTSSRLGSYVHAGAFDSRDEAEILSMRLKACKIRSQVVYFRNGRPV